jgi:hypothetical protein
MSLQESYNMLENMSKRFRLDDNAIKVKKTSEDKDNDKQRTASTVIANNIQSSTTEQDKDQLCAKTISEIVKLANEKVQSRTASVTNSTKIDEVGLLQTLLARAGQFRFN